MAGPRRWLTRYGTAEALATVLSIAAGVVWYLWHSRVQVCGARGLGEPQFPAILALVVLVPPVPLITYFRARAEHRSDRQVVGSVVFALVLVLVAIGIAEVGFLSDRHCFE